MRITKIIVTEYSTSDEGKSTYYTAPGSIEEIVWDAFLTAQYEDEHWHDEDTCDLIVRKLKGEVPIERLNQT